MTIYYNNHLKLYIFYLQRKAIELIPPLPVIFKELTEPNVYDNYGETIELLYWVLLRLRDSHIKSVQKEQVCFIIIRYIISKY